MPQRLLPGSRVTVYGRHGSIVYLTSDNWYGVRLDGETRVDCWQPSQVTAVTVIDAEYTEPGTQPMPVVTMRELVFGEVV